MDSEGVGILNEHQFKSLVKNMHQACEGGLYSFEQDVDVEVEQLLEAVDPQNNQRITYSEIVQLLSQKTVPCYPNNEITVAIVTQEARQMPILEKFVQYANIVDIALSNEDIVSGADNTSAFIQESSIVGMMMSDEGIMLMGTDHEREINRRLNQVNHQNHQLEPMQESDQNQNLVEENSSVHTSMYDEGDEIMSNN